MMLLYLSDKFLLEENDKTYWRRNNWGTKHD